VNWLAHLILSEPSPAFRIGNLLPDILRWSELRAMPAKYQRGIECHRVIDSFADSHPVFRRSMGRIEAPFRRYAGVLIDVFYDHFLARTWSRYSPLPLAVFLDEVYASFPVHREELPEVAYERLTQIWEGDWLGRYAETGGVRRALEGIGRRFRKPVPLEEATAQLILHEEALGADFAEFFPELCEHVKALIDRR
jgi:acyl carrier protein phosphodiesterase